MKPEAAINFLIPPPGYLWHWAGDGSAVEWDDGSTLCLWMEFHALLHSLTPQGLPPPGSILLVLMACGKRHPAALTSVQQFAARATGGDDAPAGTKSQLRQLRNVLEAIAALPEELRSGLPARAHLLTLLFEGNANRLTPEASREILLETDTWGIEKIRSFVARLPGTGSARLLRDLKAVNDIQHRHDLTKLDPLLRTGVEFLTIRPARVPEPQPVPGGSRVPLLRQLEEQGDRELAAIAGVARRLVAMFALPRPAGFPQELPVGGISDITNRGPLDRLLLSELAADDLVLMARLAHHEALYYRRDTPPDDPATQRFILMDSGIHLWGLPRLYALAAALGLKATGGDAAAVHRREGRLFLPLPLESVADVQASLQSLLPGPDASSALRSFAPEASVSCRPDVYFLTVPGPREPVRHALHDLACRISGAGGRLLVITISRSGALELSVRSPAGTRIAATGWIDPDGIMGGPAAAEPPPARDRLTDLPAVIRHLDFYQQYPLPFRFPSVPLCQENGFFSAGWHLRVDTLRRLMRWDGDAGPGAGEIASGLPEAPDYHINRHGREWVVVCSGMGPGTKAVAVCLGMEEPTRREVPLDSSHPFPVWMKCQNGAAILGYSGKAEACSLTDGTRQHGISLPGGTQPESVVFDGRQLGMATAPPARPPLLPPFRETPSLPAVLGVPVSAGFVASGTLVIRAQGGRWELAMPEFILTPSQKSQLAAVRPFRRVSPESGAGPDRVPSFYVADWHADCRLIFDTRGVLHVLFSDAHGRVELSLLCLIGKPAAGWVSPWPRQQVGNAEWLLKPCAAGPRPASLLVPLLQRFAALARAADPAHHDFQDPAQVPR